MAIIRAASVAIVRDDAKVLLARRTKPPFKWSFPGGRIEFGETAEAAAIREAKEEVALDVEIVGQAGVNKISLPATSNLAATVYEISVFAGVVAGGEAKTGPEASEIGWFDPAEISMLDTTEGLGEFARKAIAVFASYRVIPAERRESRDP